MPREVDEKKKRKALRKLRQAAKRAETEDGPSLSDWEKAFLEEVEERIEEYGSAFADPSKGGADEPLSALQSQKLREIDKKARGKGPGGFKRKKPMKTRARDVNAVEPEAEDAVEEEAPPAPRPSGRPTFRVIQGGREE